MDIANIYDPITIQNAISGPDSLGNFEAPDFEIEALGSWSAFRDSKKIPYKSFNWIDDPSLNKSYAEHQLDIRFWDPGIFKLKAGQFIGADTNTRIIPLEGTLVFVQPPEMNIDTTQQIPVKPIKSIIRENSSWKDYLFYIIGFILLLSIAMVLLYFQKKKKNQLLNTEIEAPYRAPHVIALEDLNKLKQEELWQKGEIKTYQSRLTDIVRTYISGRYQIPAMELTTDEIARALKQRNFNPIFQNELKQLLTMADMIKFAKAKPPSDIHDQFMNTAFRFVYNTQSTEEEE